MVLVKLFYAPSPECYLSFCSMIVYIDNIRPPTLTLTPDLIYHFRVIPMDSLTPDITHFADIFHYGVTIQAKEKLRSTINCLLLDNSTCNLLDVRCLVCKINALGGRLLFQTPSLVRCGTCICLSIETNLYGIFFFFFDYKFEYHSVLLHI